MPDTTGSFTLTLLGGFELTRAPGTPVPIPRKKSQALLAYLALAAGKRHPRDKLATLLWPDVPDRHARQSLRQSLSTLRQVLPAGSFGLSIDDDGVGLEVGAVTVDVDAFEAAVARSDEAALHEAGRLYRGDLLEGLAVSEPPFEEWLLAERERLREMALEAMGKLLAVQTRGGQHEAATVTALRLLALDPLQEAVHRALMRIHAHRGRRDAALRQYQVCVDVLQRELGTEPELETRELYRALIGRRSGEVAADEAPSPAEVASLHRADDRDSGAAPLIGRERELAQLGEILDRAFTGPCRVAALVGEAGIGKSRLAAELVAEAGRRGGRVLVGRAHQVEQALYYGPWVDALRSGNAIIDGARPDRLSAPLRAELARLFPEVGVDQPGERRAPGDPVDQLRLFEAVAQLIQALLGSGPLVVLLEDVHWADDTSLRLLAFIARRLASSPLVLAVTAREEELDSVPVLRSLLREPSVTRIALGPLSRAATASLVGVLGRTGRDPDRVQRLAEHVWTASAGNPFVVVETTRAFDLGGAPPSSGPRGGTPAPERVRELVTSRLERLSERARRLAAVSAVAGRDMDIDLLQRASGLGQDEVLDGVEELVRRRVLVAVGERLDVVHDWVRDVVYDDLLPPRRRAMHRQVAEALEAIHADDIAEHSAALGRHYGGAELWDRAVVHLRAAGSRSLLHSAYREAALSYEAALSALDRLPDARRQVEEAIDVRLEARLALAVLGEIDRIEPLLRDAERLAAGASDNGRLGLALLCQAYQHWSRGEHETGHQTLDRVVALAPTGGGPVPHRTDWIRGLLLFQQAKFREALASLAAQHAEETRVAGPPHGALPTRFATIALHQVFALVELGEFDEALEHARRGFERGRDIGHAYVLAMASTAEGVIALRRGHAAPAVTALERARDLCVDGNYLMLLPGALGHLAAAYLLAGRVDEAMRAGAEARERERPPYAGLDVALGEAYLVAGRIDEARAVGERSAAAARRLGEPARLAWSTRLLAQIDVRSAAPSAETRFRESLELAERLGMRPLAAHCHLGLGTLPDLREGGTDPAWHLAEAAKLFRQMGMTHSCEQAERARAGAEPRA